jgi:hypothetical protein
MSGAFFFVTGRFMKTRRDSIKITVAGGAGGQKIGPLPGPTGLAEKTGRNNLRTFQKSQDYRTDHCQVCLYAP